MDEQLRRYFDEQLEVVLPQLPERVHQLLDEIPLYVDDYPSPELMRRVGVRHRRHLCGLYTGIPLTQRSVQHSGVHSDVVHIFREGILEMARRRDGRIDETELRRQIRLTILHELGHHHGLTEQDLQDLGY